MNKIDYWVWENRFSKKERKKLNAISLANYLDLKSDKFVAKDKNNISKKQAETYYIYYKYLKNLIYDAIEQSLFINKHYFGYDIYPLNDYLCLNYNVYNSSNKGEYDWHTDVSNSSVLDFKLTMLINISEENFEGGELLIEGTNQVEINNFKKPGSVTIFKSYLRHKVTPVTKGIRKTLTIFLEGPRFK
tara:strand:+ start:3267 stop:3833 length:567 start_codon:yes stop_codon:yes gene_type:complete